MQQKISAGENEKSVFYYSCNLLREPKQLSEVVKTYLSWAERQGIGERIILLDEVTSVLDWARAVKHLKNVFGLRQDVFVITGSHAVDLYKGVERLPGRGVESNEYNLLPLSFRDFVELHGVHLPIFLQNLFRRKKLNEFPLQLKATCFTPTN